MPDLQQSETEKLMLTVMNLFADRFPAQAILKGGMELRLVDCPRYTNDINYIFVPYASKNEIRDTVANALKEISTAAVETSVHSTCIRYRIERNNTAILIEINVAEECNSEPLSTGSLAIRNNELPRIIRGMRFDVALAHKLAAWNERNLIRDLYDASFMTNTFNIYPETETLRKRLSHIVSRHKTKVRIRSMTIPEFIPVLSAAGATLTQQHINEELRDYFAPEELPGLDKKIKTGISRIVHFLESSN